MSRVSTTQAQLDYGDIVKKYTENLKKEVKEYEDLYLKYEGVYLPQQEQKEYSLPEIKIVNVVISTNMLNVDIDRIKNDISTEYYPKQFPGFVYRMRNPKAAILLFKTGKVICTGIRNIEDAHRALDNFTKKFDCQIGSEIKIQNLVISVDFGYFIDLEEAANSIPRAIYESEQFPGIIYRNVDPKAVFLIFTSGRCICVGTSKLEHAFDATFYIRKILIDDNLFIERKE